MRKIDIDITRVRDGFDDLELPRYQTAGSVAVDLPAAFETPVELAPGEFRLIPTGFAISLPDGYEAQVRPRSGLAYKNGVTVLNSPGTIDSDYRGEIGVILINHGKTSFIVERGMRIAQMVIAPVTIATWNEVDTLDETKRSSGGFGHTGT